MQVESVSLIPGHQKVKLRTGETVEVVVVHGGLMELDTEVVHKFMEILVVVALTRRQTYALRQVGTVLPRWL